MRRLSSIGIISIILFFIVTLPLSGNAQISGKLKDYLWKKNFLQMVRDYADESITLTDSGDYQKRIEARPYVEKNGLRVQAFAGTNQNRSEEVAYQVKALGLDSVYIDTTGGLYKVQVGNFIQRLEAEKMLDRLRFAGISNAWIVQTTIHVSKERSETTPIEQENDNDLTGEGFFYSIQLFVTNSPEKAAELARRFAGELKEEIWYIRQGNLWKVLAGKYTNEEEARNHLDIIQKAGYQDAWITQVDD
ncbi:MAG: SPOR domain-containing protein [Calditrichia bacterium]